MDNKEETKTEAPSKGLKYTPRQYAVCSLFAAGMVWLFTAFRKRYISSAK
ncbi:MAG: hypothetical protein IKR73_06805 [Oscillospiraceae bacterium]|nr:hypothetical protein [Oscillospiraceae bacterium]